MAEDVIWDALARALVGEYEILTRLGFGRGDAPVYLARELVDRHPGRTASAPAVVRKRQPGVRAGGRSPARQQPARHRDPVFALRRHAAAMVALLLALRPGHFRHRAIGDGTDARDASRPGPRRRRRQVRRARRDELAPRAVASCTSRASWRRERSSASRSSRAPKPPSR